MKTGFLRGVSVPVLFKPTRRAIGFIAAPSEPRLEGDGRSYAIGSGHSPDPPLAKDPPPDK